MGSSVRASMGAVCVCTCACVHSCLNLGYCWASLLDSVLTIIRLYCASWPELHPGKKNKTRLQAPQVGMHSFRRLSSQMRPELSPWTWFGTSFGKKADCPMGRCRQGREESQMLACPLPLRTVCSVCCSDSLSAASLAWSSGNGGNPDILCWSLERCKTSSSCLIYFYVDQSLIHVLNQKKKKKPK